ncbi:MAG: hypothetical protein VZR64_09180, partial [Eubacterium sp.]|nr:hypothetical protein [Eubacterium sp.]
DLVDRTEAAKDSEIELQLLSRMFELYDHVSKYGIDRTFVSLYNRHGELDRVCGMRFPSCESMDVVGDRYSRYSTAFIAAMEDEKEGLWAKIKAFIAKIWKWIKEKVSALWNKIKSFFTSGKKKKTGVIAKLKSLAAGTYVRIKKAGSWAFHHAGDVGKFLLHHKKLVALIVAYVVYARKLKGFFGKIVKGVILGNIAISAVTAIISELLKKGDEVKKEAKKSGHYVVTERTWTYVESKESFDVSLPGMESEDESSGMPKEEAIKSFEEIDSVITKSMPELDKNIEVLRGIVREQNEEVERIKDLPAGLGSLITKAIGSIQDVINVAVKTAAEAARVFGNFTTAKPAND